MRTADLSVVMANRNHARHLPRALDAVLSQSHTPREVIVLDDASTDDSVQVLESYARRYRTMRVVQNASHRGVTASYNRGFALATGEYILPGAADDYILPGFIEKAMAEFSRYPQAGICTGHGSCTNGDDGPLIANDTGWCERPTYFTPEELCRRVWHTLPVSAHRRPPRCYSFGRWLPRRTCLVLGLVRVHGRRVPVWSDLHSRDARHSRAASRLIRGKCLYEGRECAHPRLAPRSTNITASTPMSSRTSAATGLRAILDRT